MDEAIFWRIVATCQDAARKYFDMVVEPQELEQVLRPLLNSPREMWLAEKEGLITRQELLDVIGAHVQTFLLHRSAKAWPDPDPMMRDIAEFCRQLSEAIDP